MLTLSCILASLDLSVLVLPGLLFLGIFVFSAFYAIAYFTKVRTPITAGFFNTVFCAAFLSTLSPLETYGTSRYTIERLDHSSQNLADQQSEQYFASQRIEPNSIAFAWTPSSETNGFPSRFIEYLEDKDGSETARLISYYKLQATSIKEKGAIVFGWDIHDLIHAYPGEFPSFRGNAHVAVYKSAPPVLIYLAVYTDSHLLFLRRGDQ